MRMAVLGLIFLGIVAAACAALLMASWTSGTAASKTGESPPVDILVAAKALSPLTILESDFIVKKQVLKKEAPQKYFSNAVQVVGKMLIVPMAEGQVLTPECFGERDSGAKFAATIPEGMVAVSIPLKSNSSLEGLLYPGCLVDVMVTLSLEEGKEAVTNTFLQAVRVLAVDQNTVTSTEPEATRNSNVKQHGEARMVTLMLTPKQAKLLQLATERGSVSLALRNPDKPIAPDSESVSLSELMGIRPKRINGAPSSQPALVFPTAEKWNMELIQGGKKETRSFEMPEGK
jgi:pilus assembly protein CpaB